MQTVKMSQLKQFLLVSYRVGVVECYKIYQICIAADIYNKIGLLIEIT